MKILKQSQQRTVDDATAHIKSVAEIIEKVRKTGDEALLYYNSLFDKCDRKTLRISPEEIKAAYQEVSEQEILDLKETADNLEAFAKAQKSTLQDLPEFSPEPGVVLGHRIIPVESCCCYVPAGAFPLFTSAQHLAIPAQVAGVKRVVACSPTMKGTDRIHPKTLVALDMAGITEIYAIGGAHAIAAFAYGTEQIRPVDMIVGPGNIYVTEAKRQCYGQVGIDFIAGPSEVLAICDQNADPDIVAADMLAQSEHDPNAKGFVLTTSEEWGYAVIKAVEEQLQILDTADIASQSWERFGEVIVFDNLDDIVATCNEYAPEHLEVMVKEPEQLIDRLYNYGSLFIGSNTAEVFGDYLSGTNHTLPTARAARYTGGVFVGTFLKFCTHQWMTEEAMVRLTPAVSRLARSGYLVGHARAAEIRAEKQKSRR